MKYKDAYEHLKTADIVVLMDKSKVKDSILGEGRICKYFLSSCENQLRDSKNKYEISYYILCNNKHKFRFYNLGQIVEPYSVDLYRDIKNYIETNKNMLSYKIQLAVDDLDVTIYFNKNKCKMQIDLCSFKAMDVDGKFEEEYNYIKDFENKILILEIYKNICKGEKNDK